MSYKPTTNQKGEFVRKESSFRNQIEGKKKDYYLV